MSKRDTFLEMYFRAITLLFWTIVIYNWIFIPNIWLNLNIFKVFFAVSLTYLIVFSICKLGKCPKIIFSYRFVTAATFIISALYILLFSNNMKLLFIKSIMILIYLYISVFMVYKQHDEEGVVGIIGSMLLFIFGIYY